MPTILKAVLQLIANAKNKEKQKDASSELISERSHSPLMQNIMTQNLNAIEESNYSIQSEPNHVNSIKKSDIKQLREIQNEEEIVEKKLKYLELWTEDEKKPHSEKLKLKEADIVELSERNISYIKGIRSQKEGY